MLVRNKLDMQLREILLRERAVRKEFSDSPNTSKRYGCASLEGSKRAKLRTKQYPSSSTFGKKADFSYLRKTRSLLTLERAIAGNSRTKTLFFICCENRTLVFGLQLSFFL